MSLQDYKEGQESYNDRELKTQDINYSLFTQFVEGQLSLKLVVL